MARPTKQTVDYFPHVCDTDSGIANAPYSWWVGISKLELQKELADKLDIKAILGAYYEKFICWCAQQRLIYEPDLFDELKEFKNTYIDSRLYNTDINLYLELRKRIFERDDYTCKYCGVKGGRLELDHIIPVSRGGDSSEENLTTACFSCNRSKRNKTLEEFSIWRTTHG